MSTSGPQLEVRWKFAGHHRVGGSREFDMLAVEAAGRTGWARGLPGPQMWICGVDACE